MTMAHIKAANNLAVIEVLEAYRRKGFPMI